VYCMDHSHICYLKCVHICRLWVIWFYVPMVF